MGHYQLKTIQNSGIINDPNVYSDDSRYIVDLIGRALRASIETLEIVFALPKLVLEAIYN
jgi:predicted helicase